MSSKQPLQVSTLNSEQKLTPQQKKFNTLIRQIEDEKKRLAHWRNNVASYQAAHVKVILPLFDEMRLADRTWIFALDDAWDKRGWTNTERELMAEVICQVCEGLLRGDSADEELKQMFAKYNDEDFETDQAQALQESKEMMEAMSGLDLGDMADIQSEEDLLNRAEEIFRQQHEATEAIRAAKAEKKRKTAAQKKREEEQLQATQSVREIYRKLASALHPDREPDEAQRRVKTELMQKVNQAYAANDLLSLMEIQLQIEQVDLEHIASASAEKMKHYNKVLAEQLRELKMESEHMEFGFREHYGIRTITRLNPEKLLDLIKLHANQLRAQIAQIRQDTAMLDDKKATKAWLKQVKKQMDAEYY